MHTLLYKKSKVYQLCYYRSFVGVRPCVKAYCFAMYFDTAWEVESKLHFSHSFHGFTVLKMYLDGQHISPSSVY